MNELPSILISVVLHVLGPQPFIFLGIDKPLNLARDPRGFIKLQVLAHAPDQPLLIFGIEYLEALLKPRFLPMSAQQPVRQSVKRADP